MSTKLELSQRSACDRDSVETMKYLTNGNELECVLWRIQIFGSSHDPMQILNACA